MDNGYFTCAAGGYVTFRARLYSTEVTADPADLKSALTTWLHGQDTDKNITIYGMQYSVEPGPCGVTVPNLNAPQCSTPDTTDISTVAAVSSTVTTSTPTQDNTAVIVASVFASMFFILSLGLIGHILTARRWGSGLAMYIDMTTAWFYGCILCEQCSHSFLCCVILETTNKPKVQKWKQHMIRKWHQNVTLGTFHVTMILCAPAQTFAFSATQAMPMEWQSSQDYSQPIHIGRNIIILVLTTKSVWTDAIYLDTHCTSMCPVSMYIAYKPWTRALSLHAFNSILYSSF